MYGVRWTMYGNPKVGPVMYDVSCTMYDVHKARSLTFFSNTQIMVKRGYNTGCDGKEKIQPVNTSYTVHRRPYISLFLLHARQISI